MNKEPEIFNLLFNTSHYIGNGQYEIKLPSSIQFKTGDSLRVSSYNFYNSVFNISSALGNNSFSIKWVDGTVYKYVLSDGYYSFDDINSSFQFYMAKDSLYLVDTSSSTSSAKTGNFFISCNANTIQYTAELNVLYVPSTLPSGLAIPDGATWTLPTNPTFPQITLCDGLLRLFGFSGQSTFPLSQDASSLQNYLRSSDIYVKLSPTFDFHIGCNLIYNRFQTLNPHIFMTIPIDDSYGKLLKPSFSDQTYYSITAGSYSKITITFYDTDLNNWNLIDPEMALTLCIRIAPQNVS